MANHDELRLDPLGGLGNLIDRVAEEDFTAYLETVITQERHPAFEPPLRLPALFNRIRHVEHARLEGKMRRGFRHHCHQMHPRTGESRDCIGVDQGPLR